MTTKTKTKKDAILQEQQRLHRPAAGTPDPDAITTRALLVSLTIKMWSARKFDRNVTEEVNRKHMAGKDAGRYNKHLFGGVTTKHSAIVSAAAAARQVLYANTLPWGEDGTRLLPTSNHDRFMEEMRAALSKYDGAVAEFVPIYPEVVEMARGELNGLFNEADYPPPNEIEQRFGWKLRKMPLPATGDFRLDDLPADQIKEIEASVREHLREATAVAMRDAWQRLYDVVCQFHEKLSRDSAPDAKPLARHATIRIASEVADALSRLNVTNDPNLEAMRKRVADELATLDARDLKADADARSDAVQKAAEIMDAMKGFFGGDS